MKKLTISCQYVVVPIALLFSSVVCSGAINSYDQGELAGSLGFGAMTVDAYYEQCFSKGHRTDNNLKGIDKLLKEKWGISFSEKMQEEGPKSGRNYRDEAHKLVSFAIQKSGGCDSDGMKRWFRAFQDIHETNLKKFHAAE